MITFFDGKVEKANASVTLDTKVFPAFYRRDEEGNLEVSFDYEMEPEAGDSVVLVLHAENDSTYKGALYPDSKGKLVFRG